MQTSGLLYVYFSIREGSFVFNKTHFAILNYIGDRSQVELLCSATQEGPTETQVFTVNATVSPRGDNNKKLTARLESSIQVVQS